MFKIVEKKIADIINQLDPAWIRNDDSREVYTPRMLSYDPKNKWYGIYDPVHIAKLRVLVRLGYLDKHIHAGKWRYFTYYMFTKSGQEIADKFSIDKFKTRTAN